MEYQKRIINRKEESKENGRLTFIQKRRIYNLIRRYEMKNFPKLLIVALFALGGCSTTGQEASKSSSSASSAVINTTTSEMDTSSLNTSSSMNSSQNDLSTEASSWQSVFNQAGFTISNIEDEKNEFSFDAYQNGNWIEIDIQKSINAQSAFQDELDLNDPDNKEIAHYQNDKAELFIIQEIEEQEYQIIALDPTQGFIYTLEQVDENQLQPVLDILATLNFPVTD